VPGIAALYWAGPAFFHYGGGWPDCLALDGDILFGRQSEKEIYPDGSSTRTAICLGPCHSDLPASLAAHLGWACRAQAPVASETAMLVDGYRDTAREHEGASEEKEGARG
jgi:hypothetical protein